MTREQAIQGWIIPAIKNTWSEKNCQEIIKALEQQPCEDAISRQAVNEIINDIRDCISVEGYWAILERLKKLQPVTPQQNVENPCIDCGMNCCVDEVCKKKNEFLQQKVGRWIYKKELRDESLPYGQQVKYECSICEFHSRTNVFNYCPNCGAKMEVEE